MGRRKVMKVRGEERRKKEGGENRKWSREPGGWVSKTLALGDHTLTQTRGRVLSPINR